MKHNEYQNKDAVVMKLDRVLRYIMQEAPYGWFNMQCAAKIISEAQNRVLFDE